MAGADEDEQPVGELFSRLIDEGKAYARAEANLVRVRAEVQVDRARRPLLFGAIALTFAFAALVAFALTLTLWMIFLLGPLGGGLVAVAIFVVLAGAFAFAAKSSWERRP